MHKEQVRLTQVYRINGRLVVANSIEGAINTWREWNQPNCPDIRSIERMGNDSYQTVGDDALVIAEELCGDMTNELTEELAQRAEPQTIPRIYETQGRTAQIALPQGAHAGALGIATADITHHPARRIHQGPPQDGRTPLPVPAEELHRGTWE